MNIRFKLKSQRAVFDSKYHSDDIHLFKLKQTQAGVPDLNSNFKYWDNLFLNSKAQQKLSTVSK